MEKLTVELGDRTRLSLTQRWDDWHCCTEFRSHEWDCGATIEEAIRNWIITRSPERLQNRFKYEMTQASD